MSLFGNWNYPTTIKAGVGRTQELPDLLWSQGISQPLLVTDPGLATLPMTREILRHCKAKGLETGLFSGIKPNPTERNISTGVTAYRAGSHDGIIALGGGSAMDAAKAIALMVGQHRPLWDFEDIGDNWQRVQTPDMAPVVALPTTAGTGSEVGRAAVITDELEQRKRLIFHPQMLPCAVILDPELCIGLPPQLTAATGMDALSHSLEAFCAPGFHPMADGIAVEGMRLVKNYLPRAVADGQDREARMMMLAASSMGATAFQKGLGAMHALAHPFGAVYDVHHGMLNAILMPYVLLANKTMIEQKLAYLAGSLELRVRTAAGFIEWVLSLRESLRLPHSLSALGIGEEQLERIGAMAVADAAASSNPIAFSAAQYTDLARRAVRGTL